MTLLYPINIEEKVALETGKQAYYASNMVEPHNLYKKGTRLHDLWEQGFANIKSFLEDKKLTVNGKLATPTSNFDFKQGRF